MVKLNLMNQSELKEIKAEKLQGIKALFKSDAKYKKLDTHYNFLNAEERELLDTGEIAVSSWGYNQEMLDFINKFSDKTILEFGAGNKESYYKNIVNLEIMNYPSTDIRAYGENLPFI